MTKLTASLALSVIGSAVLIACGGGGGRAALNTIPTGVTQHSVTTYSATGVGAGTSAGTQDLLTAGLGISGIKGSTPAYVDPANPTALELRRNALYSNYRGLVDYTTNGGFGSLYGPNIDVSGNPTLGEGLIPGKEYVASYDDGSGMKRSVFAVLVPNSFNTSNPCIVAGPSSGSRGVYGAIATAGEWGLKRGCAVVLSDAGKGMGLYDMMDDTVHKIDGTRATRANAGSLSHFAANISDGARAAFNALFPNRLALKQAHSQQNPEKDWGSDTLRSINYAFYVLNDLYGATTSEGKQVVLHSANTMVIAASVSNGGGAVLLAAEQDTQGLIDGVVAAEPNIQPNTTSGYSVVFNGSPVSAKGKSLYDYFTYANLYQPCAALATAATMGETSIYNYIPFASLTTIATNRCTALAGSGLVTGANTTERANDALAKLRAYGWTTDHDTMHNAHYGLGNAAIITMMYSNAYGRFSVTDNICGLSAAAVTSGNPVAIGANAKAQSFATGNGTVNGTPASVVYNDSVGGAKVWSAGISPSTSLADFSYDSALCLRALATGRNPVTDAALTSGTTPTLAQSQAVNQGISEVQATGNLRSKPAIIVAGRSDALIPVNHAGRAYAGLSKVQEGNTSNLRYLEVTNAQHFDGFLPFSGFDNRFVPLHVYFNRAMDSMYAKLKNGTALPDSQVVRTTPRGGTAGAAPAITAINVPVYPATPAGADAITLSGSGITVPN